MNESGKMNGTNTWVEKVIHFFEFTEKVISVMIAMVVLVIVVVATLSVFKMAYELIIIDFISGSTIEFSEFSKIFGRMITILIGLEFMNSILKVLKLRNIRVLAGDVALISALAICRKLIILDYSAYDPIHIFGFGSLLLALGLFYYLIRANDWIGRNKNTPSTVLNP